MPPNKICLSAVTAVVVTIISVVSCVSGETLVGLQQQKDSQSNSLRHSPSQVFSTPLDSINEPKGFNVQSSYGSSAESLGGYPSQQYAPSSSNAAASSSSSSSYEVPLTQGGSSQGNQGAYTYYYQHYPHGGPTGGGGGGILEGHSDDHLGGLGGGLAGLGGIGGLGILAAAAKGILAIKPFLILGLLFLIALPILLLFLPLPIITITGQTGVVPNRNSTGRSTSPSQGALAYLTTLSSKVLNSEECLERVFCKMPQAPESYKKKARQVWEAIEGHPFLQKSPRISRGLQAYFDPSLGTKNRNLKCNQKFRCSNKFL